MPFHLSPSQIIRKIYSTIANSIRVTLYDDAGVAIDSHSGALNVHVKDVHHDIINRFFALHTVTTTGVAVAVSIGDTSITVDDATLFTVGAPIEIEELSSVEATTIFITAKVGNVLTLDRPLNSAYTTGAIIELLSIEIHNANGTLTSPVIFQVEPPTGKSWHIDRIILSATDNGAIGDNRFISALALINGMVLKVDNGVDRNMTNWKSNQDMITDSFDVVYSDKAGAGTENGVRVRWTFKTADTVVLLNGTDGDSLQFLIQDNIAALGLNDIRIKAQGHEV